MSSFTRNVAFVLSLLLLLPAVAIVAAPPPGPTISTPSISPSSPGPSDQVTVTTSPGTATNTWIELALVAATLGVGGTIAFYSLRPKTRTGSTSASQT